MDKEKRKKIVITHLPLTKEKEEVYGIIMRSRVLINAICEYSKELKRAGVEVYERNVNIIHTEQGYYCAFYEEDIKQKRTQEKEQPKPFKSLDGRMKVILTDKEGNEVVEDLAKLMALSFIPNPEKYSYVIFKDKNPENCKIENLEWSEIQQKL